MQVPRDATSTLMARYSEAADDRNYAVIDGIAVIPIQGTLLKKESFLTAWSGATSYEQIQRQVASAVEDGGIQGILLDIDSPGGETTGCFELADYLYSVRGLKPIFASANDIALSAAYALASSASRVFVTRTGAVGSIGVYALHVDQSGYDQQIGAKYTYVFAGKKKVEGNPHEPLAEGARTDIQAEVDREYDIFTSTVARNRKADQKDIIATQAGVQWAENSIPLLADAVGTFDDAMSGLLQVVGARGMSMAASAAISTQGDHMKHPVQAAAAAEQPVVEQPAVEQPKAADPTPGKPKAEEPEAAAPCDPDKAAADPTGDEDDKDKKQEPDDDPDDKEGKKAALVAALQPGEPLMGVRTEGDIQAIGALCKLAGCPERATEFLMAKTTSGKYFSVAEISGILTAERVAESESHMINSNVDPNKTGVAKMEDLQAEATAFVRQNKGMVAENLYVPGQSRVTPEKAMARALEANPEAYAAYRDEHNGAALVATLQKAGFAIVRK
jgi:signal peptide peptidase SppA